MHFFLSFLLIPSPGHTSNIALDFNQLEMFRYDKIEIHKQNVGYLAWVDAPAWPGSYTWNAVDPIMGSKFRPIDIPIFHQFLTNIQESASQSMLILLNSNKSHHQYVSTGDLRHNYNYLQ
jgi:hypothetical protein